MVNDKSKKISRHDFLKLSETATLSLVLSACGLHPEQTVAPEPTEFYEPITNGHPAPSTLISPHL
jgi:hypothetical protein